MTLFPCPPQPEAPPLDTTNPGSTETVAKVNDTPETKGDVKENSMPPILEEFIPSECLPDMIDVYVDKKFVMACRREGIDVCDPPYERSIRFVRQYPERPAIDKVLHKVIMGMLDLRRFKPLGVGSHSSVFLAPLTFPSSMPRPFARGAVAVKFSNPNLRDCKMLMNEAKIYNAFPHNLQGGDVPIVPKFYGFYTPCEISERVNNKNGSCNLDMEEWPFEIITPIILMEACGRACDHSLSDSARGSIGTLVTRLHEARFGQGSMYHRNVVVQPGPLSVPPANRSLKEPSYRIIDFGRGTSLGVNTSSLEQLENQIQYLGVRRSSVEHVPCCLLPVMVLDWVGN